MCIALLLARSTLLPVAAQQGYKLQVGEPGKDVVWVPILPEVVEKMLDLAKVMADDFVIDLGSGDGRMEIAAAKRGARALGVEFNPEMVKLAQQRAIEAGVAGPRYIRRRGHGRS